MTDNLRHWDELGRTDPAHTKPFQRAGGFKGTATRPIWIEYRMTQHFGPCGVGWGMDKPEHTLVPAGDELLVFCTVRVWYRDGEQIGEVFGVGGDKVLVKRQAGIVSDDEAYKKAFTDAVGNALKHIGVGADVHMGRFDDSKYVSEVRAEFAGDKEQANVKAPQRPAAPGAPYNGSEHPKRQQALDAFWRIKAALTNAATPKLVDEIESVNGQDLRLIMQVHEPSYDQLIALANARKREFRISERPEMMREDDASTILQS